MCDRIKRKICRETPDYIYSCKTKNGFIFNASNAVTPHIQLNDQPLSVVHKNKYLGNYISD